VREAHKVKQDQTVHLVNKETPEYRVKKVFQEYQERTEQQESAVVKDRPAIDGPQVILLWSTVRQREHRTVRPEHEDCGRVTVCCTWRAVSGHMDKILVPPDLVPDVSTACLSCTATPLEIANTPAVTTNHTGCPPWLQSHFGPSKLVR